MMQFTIGSRKGGHRSQARGSSSASPSPAFSSTSPTIIITVITIVFIPPSCSCLCRGHTIFVFFLSSSAPILHPSFSSPLHIIIYPSWSPNYRWSLNWYFTFFLDHLFFPIRTTEKKMLCYIATLTLMVTIITHINIIPATTVTILLA